MLCLQYALCGALVYMVSSSGLPTIIKSAPIWIRSGWMELYSYLMPASSQCSPSYFQIKTREEKHFHIFSFDRCKIFAFYASYLMSPLISGFPLLLTVAVWRCLPYGPFFAWISEILPSNNIGGAIALINSSRRITGSFTGSYLVEVFKRTTGRVWSVVYNGRCLCLLSAILTIIVYRNHMNRLKVA